MRPRRLQQVDVDLSFRLHDCAGPCCYVTSITMREDGQRSVNDSRHITGSPERVVDLALALARERILEDFLTLCQTF